MESKSFKDGRFRMGETPVSPVSARQKWKCIFLVAYSVFVYNYMFYNVCFFIGHY